MAGHLSSAIGMSREHERAGPAAGSTGSPNEPVRLVPAPSTGEEET